MPSMRPSRLYRSSWTASVSFSRRKKAFMSLPLPSGSSPPEKPPGMTSIWLRARASAMRSRLSSTPSGLRLRTTSISGSAPARARARAVSYSQFVPGKTGMSACGRGVRVSGAGRFEAV